MSSSALAQDACALNCSARENAWCTGQEWYCAFNFRDCMQACEGEGRQDHHSVIPPPPPPCMVEQNAMRPCSSKPEPVGVDGNLVGTWELKVSGPLGASLWIWQIRQDGTYQFHAEGPGAAPAHSGTFAASEGHYTLQSTTMNYSDAGTYRLVASTTLSATGQLGTGTWHRAQAKSATSSAPNK